MSRSRRRPAPPVSVLLLWPLCCLLLSGCGEDTTPSSGSGRGPDAGPLDGAQAPPEDSGVSAPDARTSSDGGRQGDLGGQGTDLGPADQGPTDDGGDLPQDAGPAADAGGEGGDAGDADGGASSPSREEALEILRASIVDLSEWRFRTDPGDEGLPAGWQGSGFDDSDWELLRTGSTWEEQGHQGYDGVAWYRTRVQIPADWEGSPRIRLVASGVDDEYAVYVNGAHAGQFGQPPDRSVFGWRTYTRLGPLLRYGEENVIAIRVVDWGGGGGLWRDVALRRAVDLSPWAELLPDPVLDDNPEWVELYWFAWQQAFEKVGFGTEGNGFVEAYMDEGFNEQVYQWDSSFMVLFGRYGLRLLPVMPTLDNFYERQEPDGYIQRVYSETTGRRVGDPSPEEPMVNPPLFAWVEWEYWRFAGDSSRLRRVLPVLERYYEWLRANVAHDVDEQHRLYYQTELGSGMDNTPRGADWRGVWADMSAQQGLAAWCMARLWEALGEAERSAAWDAEHQRVKAAINRYLWNDTDDFYFDRNAEGGHGWVRHLGSYWVLLARVAWPGRAEELIAHLRHPDLFARRHLFPSLAANHPDYDPNGHYWRGGVWAPLNYMVIQGLAGYGHADLAHRAAVNHIERLVEVFHNPPANEERFAPEERRPSYSTLWECYAPDHPQPATRWDGWFLSRQDFVGWTGLGPIALLIEQAIGIQVLGAERRVIWTLRRLDRHGVRRLPLGLRASVDLVAEARQQPDVLPRVHVRASEPFELELRLPGQEPRVVAVPAGEGALDL